MGPSEPLRSREDHYAIKPGKTKEEIKETAQRIFKKAAPIAAGLSSGTLTFSVSNLTNSWLSDDCTGYKMMIAFYLFSLLVIVGVHQATARYFFTAKKRD